MKDKKIDINLQNIRLGDKQAYEDYLYGKSKTKIAKERKERIKKIQRLQREALQRKNKEFYTKKKRLEYKKKFEEKYINTTIDEIRKKNEELKRRDEGEEDTRETIVI